MAFAPSTMLVLEQKIRSGEIPSVHSVLVLQHGNTVYEQYFSGPDEERFRTLGVVRFDAATLHDIRSVTKSVVSLLFGIAVAEGAVESLDAPALDYFPEYADLRTPERLKIRLRDVLSMTSGLAWDEDTLPYTDPRNSETAMDMVPDRYRYVLEQAAVTPPGEAFTYSGGSVALAAKVLTTATGMPLDVYAQAKLWEPLDVTNQVWLTDSKGEPIAASGLRLIPRDMAKIGQLMLDHGVWNGQQVVPHAWVVEATAAHARVDSDPRCGQQYGYFWWLSQGCIATPPEPYYEARGNGGQRIWVLPSRDMVVVMTAGAYNNGPVQNKVVPAVLSGALAASVTSRGDTTPPRPRQTNRTRDRDRDREPGTGLTDPQSAERNGVLPGIIQHGDQLTEPLGPCRGREVAVLGDERLESVEKVQAPAGVGEPADAAAADIDIDRRGVRENAAVQRVRMA